MDLRALIMIVALALCWGPSFLFIKIALQQLDPLSIGWARISIGCLVLLVSLYVTGRRLPIFNQGWWRFVVSGFLMMALPFVLIGLGEEHTSSAITAIVHGTVPIMTAALVYFFVPQEPLTRQRIMGIGLGFSGLLLLVLPGLAAEGLQGDVLGILLVAAAMLSYAIGIVFTRLFLVDEHPFSAAAAQSLCAVLLTSSAMLLLSSSWRLPRLENEVLASILVLGLVGSGFAYILYFAILKRVGAIGFTMVLYLVPCIGALIGVLFGGESLSFSSVGAMALILSGLYMATTE